MTRSALRLLTAVLSSDVDLVRRLLSENPGVVGFREGYGATDTGVAAGLEKPL